MCEREERCVFFGDREVQDECTVTHGPHPSEARGRLQKRTARFALRVRTDARYYFEFVFRAKYRKKDLIKLEHYI